MSHKNLLADTDFTDSRDQRFVHSVVIGKVSKIEVSDKGANIRVIMPDKIDHDGQPLITKPIPVLQICAGKKRQFAMPCVGQNALLVKLPNSTASYGVLGFFYTSKDPPPVTDPLLDYTVWDDEKTFIKFDGNKDADPFLTWDFQGGWKATAAKDINIKTTNGAKVTVEGDGQVTIKSDSSDIIVDSASGKVTIQGATGVTISDSASVTVQAPTIKLQGNIVHTGDITTSGVHTDSLGHHH